MKISVLKKDGSVRASMPSDGVHVSNAKISSTFMANDTLSLSCSSRDAISFEVGDTVTIDGSLYRMNQSAQIKRSGSSGQYEYTLTFESIKYDLLNVRFLLPDDTVGDFMVANLRTLALQVVSNACRVYGANSWILGSCPTTEVITKQFTEQNCLAALQGMVKAFEEDFDKVYEFRVVSANGLNVIIIFEEDGGTNAGINLAYGHAGGLYSITRQSVSTENMVSRLFAYGSSDNLPTGYRHSRLCMQNKSRNESYVQSSAAMARIGTKEGFATFEDIKPRALFKVDQVSVVTNTSISSGYNIKIKSNALSASQQYGFYPEANWDDTEDDYMEWLEMFGYVNVGAYMRNYYNTHAVGNKKYLVDGEMTVTFNTGKCAGIAFKVLQSSTNSNGEMTLITQEEKSERADRYFIPSRNSGDTWGISVGDEFVISDIMLPMALVHKAEGDLELRATEELTTMAKANARYAVEFDDISLMSMDIQNLIPGNFVHVTDSSLGIDDNIKITRVDKDLIKESVSIEISTIKRKHRISGYVERVTGQDTVERDDVDGVHTTSLTCHIEPNYESDVPGWTASQWNTLHIGSGTFINWSLLGSRKEWRISERLISMDTDTKYDIYVQASKKTSLASVVLRKNRQIQLAEISALRPDTGDDPIRGASPNLVQFGAIDDGSLYFKIGSISEAKSVRGVLGSKYRTINLDYGTTTAIEDDIVVSGYGNLQVMLREHNANFANLQGFASSASEDFRRIRYIMERNFNAIEKGTFESYDQTYCEADRGGTEVCRQLVDDDLIPEVPIIK